MRTSRTALLAGAAAVATALGFCGAPAAVWAQDADTHVMTVRLPGGIAEIRYTGDVAPQVSISNAPAPAPVEVFAPMPAGLWGPDSRFAALDRISAEMDREAAAMFRQAESLAAAARSGQLTETAMRGLPPGSAGYSLISTMTGNGVCTQSLAITSQGNGAPPRVVSHSSGNCGPMSGQGGTVDLPTATVPPADSGGGSRVWTSAPAPTAAPAPAARPDVLWTSAHGAHPYAGLVEEIPPALPQQQR